MMLFLLLSLPVESRRDEWMDGWMDEWRVLSCAYSVCHVPPKKKETRRAQSLNVFFFFLNSAPRYMDGINKRS